MEVGERVGEVEWLGDKLTMGVNEEVWVVEGHCVPLLHVDIEPLEVALFVTVLEPLSTPLVVAQRLGLTEGVKEALALELIVLVKVTDVEEVDERHKEGVEVRDGVWV